MTELRDSDVCGITPLSWALSSSQRLRGPFGSGHNAALIYLWRQQKKRIKHTQMSHLFSLEVTPASKYWYHYILIDLLDTLIMHVHTVRTTSCLLPVEKTNSVSFFFSKMITYFLTCTDHSISNDWKPNVSRYMACSPFKLGFKLAVYSFVSLENC